MKRVRRIDRWNIIADHVSECMKKNDASHDFSHVLRVVRNVENILKTENWPADEVEAARIAALAHELCDNKYVNNKEEAKGQLRSALSDAGVSAKTADVVAEVVPLLSFSRRLREGVPTFRSKKARKVYLAVSDADYLEALGITGVIRTNVYQAVRQNSDAATATQHIETVLYHCVDHLTHEWSKEEGARRLDVMKSAMEQFKREQSI
jgi:HD superfamily phosphodiesterase